LCTLIVDGVRNLVADDKTYGTIIYGVGVIQAEGRGLQNAGRKGYLIR
jgi:hypothetical protein